MDRYRLMPYYLYDVNGYLADGPTTDGWRQLRSRIEMAGPASFAFVADGFTDAPGLLADELETVSVADGPIADSLAALIRVTRSADDALVLTDGVDVLEEAV